MAITYNNGAVRKINYNGNSVKKVLYNGVVVFQSSISVNWSIYYSWDNTVSSIQLEGTIVDSVPLSPSDVITVRVQGDPGIASVELSQAEPEKTFYATSMYFNPYNTVEFLVNGVLKTTASWHRPDQYSSSTESGTVDIEL